MISPKKMLQLVAISAFLLTIPCQAMAAWYTCTVIKAGPSNGSSYVLVSETNNLFTNRWFKIDPTHESQQLATFLTAMSAGKQVQIDVSGTTGGQTVAGVYLN